MNALAPAIKGWCPGALRPMPTGDGLLARVRPSAGRLSLDQVEALADAADACGAGTIELTSRANLQLRGLGPEKLGELAARLEAIGLIDADPDIERVRNIVASPLADLDPDASCDILPYVPALEARIAVDPDLRALPAKFSFVIDAGGRWPLGDVDADVKFEGFASVRGLLFAVRLPPRSAVKHGLVPGMPERAVRDDPAALIAPDDLPDAAARLARTFHALAGSGAGAPRRMRALVERDGEARVFVAAGLEPTVLRAPSRVTSPSAAVGVLDLRDGVALGAAPPFGRMSSDTLAALARAARKFGASGARLTPWRTIALPGLDTARAERLARALEALGCIVARDDPRLGVIACSGAPACAHANADTLAVAAQLAGAIASRNSSFHGGLFETAAARAPLPVLHLQYADTLEGSSDRGVLPSPLLRGGAGGGALAAAGPLEKGNPRRGEPHPQPLPVKNGEGSARGGSIKPPRSMSAYCSVLHGEGSGVGLSAGRIPAFQARCSGDGPTPDPSPRGRGGEASTRAMGVLHVSGCAKGCAHAAPAPFTLVATPEGYDLVIGGRAGDAPAHRGLSLLGAVALVGGLSA